MGCNCKKQVDTINQKYGNGIVHYDWSKNPVLKAIQFIVQIAFGILCGGIIIVMVVPMTLYVILCLMFGKEAHFRIKDYNKLFNKDT